MKNIAVLVSGGGSNLQAIVDSSKQGILKGIAQVVLVISNNSKSYALERAEKENIKAVCIEKIKFNNLSDFNDAILAELKKYDIDLICLAGYLSLLGAQIVRAYKGKILNIHPALLPKFGGKGMFGIHVHEAVIKDKENKSGATVHLIDENYDTGDIVLQKEISILQSDNPQTLAKKVLSIEHEIYPEAIKKLLNINIHNQ
jgi:phosphoribosylglycinamide formyltransferase-1